MRKLPIRRSRLAIRSVVATGGVYKGQGRNRRELMTRAYREFLVHEVDYRPQSLARKRLNGYASLSGYENRVVSFNVARVRPRTSKGITDLLLLNLVRLDAACPSKKSQKPAGREGKRVDYLAGQSLVRYRNKPDKSLHQLRTAMHHHPPNRERALNLSILPVSGPGEFSRVESN